MSYSSPILPPHFRMLNVGGRYTGSTMHNISIANSRKWTVSLFDCTLNCNNNHLNINNQVVIVNNVNHPDQILRMLKCPGSQLAIFERSSVIQIMQNPKLEDAFLKLMQRSYASSNFEYPISLIVTAQYYKDIPVKFRDLFSFTDISRERYLEERTKINDKLVPWIPSNTFNNIQENHLHNFCRMHVNNIQRVAIVHNPHMLHIPSRL